MAVTLDVIKYVYYLATVYLLIFLLWKWSVALLFALVRFPFKSSNWLPGFILKYAGWSLLASIPVIFGYGINQGHTTGFKILIYAIGAIILVFQISKALVEREKKIAAKMDYQSLYKSRHDSYLLPLSIVSYLIFVFSPALGSNQLTLWTLQIMGKIWNIPILNVVIGIIALIYVLNLVFVGFIACIDVIGNLFGLVTNKAQQKYKIF